MRKNFYSTFVETPDIIVAHADLVKTENCEELLCWSNKIYNIVKINWMKGKILVSNHQHENTFSGDKENKI